MRAFRCLPFLLTGLVSVGVAANGALAQGRARLSSFPVITQPDDISCGPTCCAMVLRYYGKNVGIGPLKTRAGTRWWDIHNPFAGGHIHRFGMTLPGGTRFGAGIEGALDHYGLQASVRRGATLRDICRYLDEGRPPILLVRSGADTWHYVVAVGYRDNGEEILLADPAGSSSRWGGENSYYLPGSVLNQAWQFGGNLDGDRHRGRSCRACGGDGNLGWTKCAKCSGRGKISWSSQWGSGWTKCLACNGDGEWSKRCDLCGGDGRETDRMRKLVETAGVSGHTLIVPNGPPGGSGQGAEPDRVTGYAEFRRRVDMVYDRSIGGPANMQNVRTPEARCIRYLMHHCAYHRGDLAGYANLRSRLDDSKEDIRRDLRDRPGAAAHWLLFLVDHCVNNLPTPEGYQELHRRLSQECWPQAEGQLKGERRVESDWVAYLIWHIVGNPATMSGAAPRFR